MAAQDFNETNMAAGQPPAKTLRATVATVSTQGADAGGTANLRAQESNREPPAHGHPAWPGEDKAPFGVSTFNGERV